MIEKKTKTELVSVPPELIRQNIYMIRGQKVILDSDLAELYGVETKILNRAVTRNKERFPKDFMFRLNRDEFDILRSQFVTSSSDWGGRRYPPRAFTENGVAMLSSVLRSKRAIKINIAIMRTFTQLRELAASSKKIADRVSNLESAVAKVFHLLSPEYPRTNKKIGFKQE